MRLANCIAVCCARCLPIFEPVALSSRQIESRGLPQRHNAAPDTWHLDSLAPKLTAQEPAHGTIQPLWFSNHQLRDQLASWGRLIRVCPLDCKVGGFAARPGNQNSTNPGDRH